MRRLSFIPALAVVAVAVSGCGGTTQHTATTQTARLAHMHLPPKWLTTVIGREDALFHARVNHGYPGNGISVKHVSGAIVVGLWGKFTSPAGRSCMPGCPVPARGNFLRLVITPDTHRVERATLIRQIDPFAVARGSSRFLRIFPSRPGTKTCRIPRGGVNLTRSTFTGRCETQYASATRQSAAAHAVRIQFGERWSMGDGVQHAAWIVTVRYRDGKILDTRIEGQPPQLWK